MPTMPTARPPRPGCPRRPDGRRRAGRADRDAQDAAAEVLLRRPRQRAVRPDHPAAGVLPDPHRARDPRRATSPTSPRLTRAETLVELGSGTSEKTRLLLRALTRRPARCAGSCRSTSTRRCSTEASARGRRRSSPGSRSSRSSATSSSHLGELPRHPRRLLAFLGSTIGNLEPGQRAAFLADVRGDAGPTATRSCSAPTWSRTRRGWSRPTTTPQGVTAAFNKNVLAVLNRELGADFDPDAFEHVAVWDAEHEWIEMRLRVDARPARCTSAALDLDVDFERGRGDAHRDLGQVPARAGVERELAAAGLRLDALVDRPGRRLRAVPVGAGPPVTLSRRTPRARPRRWCASGR